MSPRGVIFLHIFVAPPKAPPYTDLRGENFIKHFITATFGFVLGLQLNFASAEETKNITVMFWNVENLFDTVHDEGKSDEEFTPDGQLNWTEEKLDLKMKNLAKVITGIHTADGKACPDFLGMAEVEHARIAQTFNRGYLKECGYNKVIADANDPDPRGIRVVGLTRLELANQPLSHKTYPGGRFILEVSVKSGENVATLFLNHWKSRRPNPGSNDDGSSKRALSAGVLRKRVQQILAEEPARDIVAMGDFNDEPENNSFIKSLGSTLNWAKFSEDLESLFIFWNPSGELVKKEMEKGNPVFAYGIEDEDSMRAYKKLRGTFYFAGNKEYLALDNFHLSRGLFDDQGFSYEKGSFQVVRNPEFTDTMMRPIPFRAGAHPKGASDHFPILARLKVSDSSFNAWGF